MANSFFKKTFIIHKWLGLISGLILFVIGLSGSALVFREEINYVQLQPPVVSYSTTKLNIDGSFKKLAAQYPGAEIRLTNVTPLPGESLNFSIRKPKERLTVFTHPENSEVLKIVNTNSTIVMWLLNLHYTLHAGLPGKIIVFITGVLFVLSIITGFIIYRKSILKVLSFRVKFNSKTQRSLSSSLHRTVGVWSLLLNFVLAITGVLISFSIVSSGLKKKKKEVGSNQSLIINCNVDSVLTFLKVQNPGYQPNFIRIPSGSKTMQIGGSFPEDFFLYSHNANRGEVELSSGKMIGKLKRVSDKSTGEKADELIKPLHFAEYGGLPIKILYCLAGLSIPLLSISGFILWAIKRRKEANKNNVLPLIISN